MWGKGRSRNFDPSGDGETRRQVGARKKVLELAWDRGNTTKVSYVSMEVETCS